MKTKRPRSSRLSFSISCAAGVLLLFGTAAAQLPRPPADPRIEDMKKVQENNTIMAGEQKEKAAQRKKEERMAVVNEAFKRLQMLHNEMMTIMGGQTVEDAKLKAIGEEVKLRAMELNANLALPQLPAEKNGAQAKPAVPSGEAVTVTERLSSICAQIRDFVKNVNQSPSDPKSGLEARRDLVALIEKSDALILLVTSPVKS